MLWLYNLTGRVLLVRHTCSYRVVTNNPKKIAYKELLVLILQSYMSGADAL
jgi:hypothetical protein